MENTYTIEQFIQLDANDKIQFDTLSLFEKNNDGIYFPIYNVINDYIDELKSVCAIGVMSDKDFNRYKYKPKLLAYDLYGSQELFFIILSLNDMSNVKEFTKKKVKLLRKEYINDILSYIYNSEKNIIIKNRENIGM